MSAKDKAFESERAKYRQKIRALELDNHKALEREYLTREELWKLQDEIRSKDEYINRLLEYMDYQPEERVRKIASDKAMSSLLVMESIIGRSWKL